ncbi:MAG: hypothetical protein JWM59_1175 [Verrucomicrobiales bacterium]|nr:hypothetical protein [Verrucomicrobiales bacterium]
MTRPPAALCLALLAALAAAGCRKPAADVQAQAKGAGGPDAEAAPIPVKTAAATEKPMPRFLQLTGELISAQDSAVAADTTGKVAETPVERGSVVKAGDVLIRLDDRTTSLNLAEAEANLLLAQSKLALAQSDLKRNEPLAKARAIPETEYAGLKAENDGQAATVAAAAARRDSARKSQEDTRVLAPFDGVVAERMVSVGEYVRPDTQVAHLVDPARLRLVVNVAEPDIGKVKEGQPVEFTVSAWPGTPFPGTVKFIGAAVRVSSRDLLVEVEAPNADGRLRPGLFAEARLILPDQPAITVPESAVREDGTQRRLWVASEGRLQERLVETGSRRDGMLEIRRGVAAGEPVVVSPGPAAADGVRITVQP